MRNLVCYCSGGLSNRVFCLSSCVEIANVTNRKLFVYWPRDHRCDAKFEWLYHNKFEFVDESFIKSLPDVHCLFHKGDMENELHIYKRNLFHTHEFVYIGKNFSIHCDAENILICNNSFCNQVPLEKSYKILKDLEINRDVYSRFLKEKERLQIDKSIIGAHLRGTDFLIGVDWYIDKIKNIFSSCPDRKMLVCSDDEQIETEINNQFPGKIISRKKVFISKKDNSISWRNNTNTTLETLEEALIDLLLLASSELKVYHPNSSFSEYARILGV